MLLLLRKREGIGSPNLFHRNLHKAIRRALQQIGILLFKKVILKTIGKIRNLAVLLSSLCEFAFFFLPVYHHIIPHRAPGGICGKGGLRAVAKIIRQLGKRWVGVFPHVRMDIDLF